MKQLLVALVGAKLVLYHAIAAAPDVPRDALSDTDLSPEAVPRSNTGNDLEQLAAQVSPSLIERLVTREAAPAPTSGPLDTTRITRPLLGEP